MAQANKTVPTKLSVEDFLAGLDEQKSQDSRMLVEIMSRVSGQPAVMWGTSIVGFGNKRYEYDSGRSGEVPRLGFSPRKAALTLYFNEGFDRYRSEMSRLGKLTSSVSCLHIKKLADIDLAVLEEMLDASWKLNGASADTKPETVDEYVAMVPEASRRHFDRLRQLVREVVPEADEVLSYGIVGYKIENKRARVYISGWKDHVAIYPTPGGEELKQELKPYIKGKGTLWFGLDEELPEELVRKVVRELVETA